MCQVSKMITKRVVTEGAGLQRCCFRRKVSSNVQGKLVRPRPEDLVVAQVVVSHGFQQKVEKEEPRCSGGGIQRHRSRVRYGESCAANNRVDREFLTCRCRRSCGGTVRSGSGVILAECLIEFVLVRSEGVYYALRCSKFSTA